MQRNGYVWAELTERTDFSPSTARLCFRPEKPCKFVPGQFATLAFEDGEKLLQRPYSIVSTPTEPHLEFYVELVEVGLFTRRLWAMKPGDRVLVRERAGGVFTLARSDGASQILLIGTVTGVGPYVSMARAHAAHLAAGEQSDLRFTIFHAASHSSDLGSYREELTDLSKAGWLRYIPTVSRPLADPTWTGEVGRVEDVLRKHLDSTDITPANAVAYLCGNPHMIENVKGVLGRARFPAERIREEEYFTLPRAAPSPVIGAKLP